MSHFLLGLRVQTYPNQMPPQVVCTCTKWRLYFFITPDNQTFQGNLISATTRTNHLKQDQLAITTMVTSEVLYFSLISILIISIYQYFITA